MRSGHAHMVYLPRMAAAASLRASASSAPHPDCLRASACSPSSRPSARLCTHAGLLHMRPLPQPLTNWVCREHAPHESVRSNRRRRRPLSGTTATPASSGCRSRRCRLQRTRCTRLARASPAGRLAPPPPHSLAPEHQAAPRSQNALHTVAYAPGAARASACLETRPCLTAHELAPLRMRLHHVLPLHVRTHEVM